MLKKGMLIIVAVIIIAAMYLVPSAALWLETREAARLSSGNYDAIILLTGERSCRINKAVEAYNERIAPRIIVTGGPTYLNGKTEADAIAWELISRGVPSEAVIVEPYAASTWENSIFTQNIMETSGWKSAVVVTSNYHQRRSRAIFNRVYGSAGIYADYLPAVSETYDAVEWWKTNEGRKYISLEYIKVGYYLVNGRITLAGLLDN